MLKAIGQFKLFYSHYKGFIQAIDTWLVKNQYVKSTELAQALLGSIQDQFEKYTPNASKSTLQRL